MEDETQNALTALYNAYPKTQYVDYSGFIDSFQPVLNDPSMYVPQQGLLQNTPTLADITLDPTIGAYSPSVTGLLQSYPQMEQDFQSTFAVDPNTYRNFETFNRLPFDKSYWENVVGGAGGGGDGLDVSGVDEAGLIGNTNTGGGGSGGDGGTGTDTTITTSSDDGDDGSSGSDTDTKITILDTITGGAGNDTVSGGGDTDTKITLLDTVEGGAGNDTIDGSSGSEKITLIDTISGATGNDTISGAAGNNSNINILSTISGGLGADTLSGGAGNDLIEVVDDATVNTNRNNTFVNINGVAVPLSQLTAISGLNILGNADWNTANNASTLTGKIDNITVDGVTLSNSDLIKTISNATDVVNNAGQVFNFDNAGNIVDYKLDSGIMKLGLIESQWALDQSTQTFLTKAEYDNLIAEANNNYKSASDVLTKGDIQDFGTETTFFDKFGKWYNTPLNEGLGTAGSAVNNATQFTPAEVVSGVGGLLSGMAAIEDGNPSNVFNTAVGLSGTGLLGGTAYGSAAGAKGALGFATHPATAVVGTLLMIAQQHAPDPSNKTGFAGFDAETRETTSFGMEGDKFKQANVDKSTSIATAMGDTVNVIADSFGLNAKGDILAQTGNRDPLNITFGNQESEQTVGDRLNYNPEMGDITSGDNIQRWYYTGQNGIDGAKLASDTIHGTTLLALKAKANGEDSINLANMTLPTRSADEVKNTYLSQGFDETAANALTSAARSASGATSELLGGLLLANTTNEANYLTPTERESLIGQGYTNEQLDTMLYGTSEQSLAAITLLNTNEENNEENI